MGGFNGPTYGAAKKYTEEHGGGGGEPAAYLKSIEKDTINKIIKITDKNNVVTSFEYGDKEIPFVSLKRLGAYTFEVTYDNISEYIYGNSNVFVGACTTFVRSGKTYRSFDLTYDKKATFLIKTKEFDGVAYIQGINDGNLYAKKNELGQLPYHIADGCNRYGIVVSEHVLFNDFNFQGTGTKTNDITKLPYVILSNIKSMTEINTNPAVNAFLANMKVPEALSSKGYTLHFLITDGTTTYTLCPKDDGSGYEFIDITTIPKLANFKHIGKATVERNDSDLQERPTGIERFNLIGADTELKDLRFTKAYETPDRLSEFIGSGSTTKDSTDEELMPYYTAAHTAYESRTREDDNPTWQSVQAVVYGSQGIEHLFTQENYNKDYIASSEEAKVDNITIEKNTQKEIKIKSINDISTTFEETEEFENINTGDNISTLFGKIKKAISTFVIKLALKVNISDIVDNLTSSDIDKPLSAKQGKVLQDNKIEKTNIANNLTTTEEGKILDARQGKALDERLTTIEVKPDVVDIVQCYDRGTDTTKTDIVHYDLTGLFVNDIIKVISDETHNELTSYYKVIETEGVKSFNYVGSDKAIELDGTTITKNASGKISIVESLATAWNRLVTLFTNITSVVTTLTNNDTDIPTSKAVNTGLNGRVPTSRTVNGKALSSNITLTKSDVGLSNVVNTGDSATPVSGGTTKFTTGGAYIELEKKLNYSHTSISGATRLSLAQLGSGVYSWVRFTAEESPVGSSGTSCSVIVIKNQDSSPSYWTNIIAIPQNTGDIYSCYVRLDTSVAGNWQLAISSANLATRAVKNLGSVGSGKTRNDLSSLLGGNQSGIGWCKFTNEESPTGNSTTYEVIINQPMTTPYASIIAVHSSTGDIYTSVTTNGIWTNWKQFAMKTTNALKLEYSDGTTETINVVVG